MFYNFKFKHTTGVILIQPNCVVDVELVKKTGNEGKRTVFIRRYEAEHVKLMQKRN